MKRECCVNVRGTRQHDTRTIRREDNHLLGDPRVGRDRVGSSLEALHVWDDRGVETSENISLRRVAAKWKNVVTHVGINTINRACFPHYFEKFPHLAQLNKASISSDCGQFVRGAVEAFCEALMGSLTPSVSPAGGFTSPS